MLMLNIDIPANYLPYLLEYLADVRIRIPGMFVAMLSPVPR